MYLVKCIHIRYIIYFYTFVTIRCGEVCIKQGYETGFTFNVTGLPLKK